MLTTAEYNEAIAQEFDALRDLVVKKNDDYDSAVFKPIGVFTSTTAAEQIKTRLDDKLKRLQHLYHSDKDLNYGEDTEADVIAYLILKRVEEKARALRETELAHLDTLSKASGPIVLGSGKVHIGHVVSDGPSYGEEIEVDLTPPRRRRRRKATPKAKTQPRRTRRVRR